jgi:ribosome-binding protein aMBF1 (putative translation factor)
MTDLVRLTAAACRAGRALLAWSQADLVAAASVSPNTVAKVEAGETVREATAARIVHAFASHGVEILNGDAPGARMRPGKG